MADVAAVPVTYHFHNTTTGTLSRKRTVSLAVGESVLIGFKDGFMLLRDEGSEPHSVRLELETPPGFGIAEQGHGGSIGDEGNTFEFLITRGPLRHRLQQQVTLLRLIGFD